MIGGIIYFTSQREVLFEIVLVVFALLELAFYFGRVSHYDRDNYKENGTIKRDKTSEKYKKYRMDQNTLLISCLINIVLSIVVFNLLG